MASSQPAYHALQNKYFTLEYLTQAGPRISALIPAGTQQNLLARLDDVSWDTEYGRYLLYGGHRLWAAPEIPEITYFPEDVGVQVSESGNWVKLWREDHGKVAYERSIEVKLEEDAPRVHLVHSLRNLSSVALNAAPWSISVLPMGAKVRIPLSKVMPGGNELLPNRSVSFWPYDDLRDARLLLQNDYVELSSDPQGGAFKIGVYSSRGWAAAQVGEWLLIKRFDVREPQNQLDFGANIEAYTNKRFVEIELVGERRNLEQDELVINTETWEILHGNLDDLDENGSLPHGK